MADLNPAHTQDKALWPVFYRMSKRGMLVDLDDWAGDSDDSSGGRFVHEITTFRAAVMPQAAACVPCRT